MVLNNFWKVANIADYVYNNGGQVETRSFGAVNINGDDAAINYAGQAGSWEGYTIPNIKLRDTNMRARVGTGTGTVDADDYALFDDCTSSIADLSLSCSVGAVDEGLSGIYTIRGINNTANTLTITEAGIGKAFLENKTTSPSSVPILFVKILLEEPIEVPANGTFEIAVQWLER